MADDNGAPPIEPVHRKTTIENETPAFLSTAASTVLHFLEKNGWFVVLGIITTVFIWSQLEPYWRKWKKKRDEKLEEANIDPARLARSQENIQLSRRQMQEAVNAKAAEHAEKMKEAEARKQQENIENWESVQKGRTKPRRRLLKTEYNPLSGSSSGPSYRPSGGGNSGGG